MQLVVKRKEGGKEGGLCGAEIADTLWRASQVPRAALHLNSRQKTTPAAHRASDGLWFAAGQNSGVFFCVGGNNKKHHQRVPAGERGYLMMEVSCEALLHSEQSRGFILQPSQVLQTLAESALLLSSSIFSFSYKPYKYSVRQLQ